MTIINSTEYLESLKGTRGTWVFEQYANNIKKSHNIYNDFIMYDIYSKVLHNMTNIGIMSKIEEDYTEHHLFVIYNNVIRYIYPINNQIEMTFEYTPTYLTQSYIDNIMDGNVITIQHDNSKEQWFIVPINIFADLFYNNE